MPKIQFSVRDLFWLVLVVAMGVAWFISYQRATGRAERMSEQSRKWRLRAGTVECLLKTGGEEVKWDLEKDHITVGYPGMRMRYRVATIPIDQEPSVVDPLDE